jgi:RNA polymerase sigma factor (sigma-70 family)
MARDFAIPPESFDEILAWFNPDRERAAAMYVQLRHDLAKTFVWRQCSDPEGLTDEVFDRVARKIREVRPTYKGDPRLYFRAVANNLVKENFKKIKTQIALEDADLTKQQVSQAEAEDADVEECLQACLEELSFDKRELILAYYAKEKQAKIDHRRQLAQRFGISVETLRVRTHRICLSLEQCIGRCLPAYGQRK